MDGFFTSRFGLVLNYILSNLVFSAYGSFSYLSEEKFGNTSLQKVLGIWSLIVALSISLLVSFAVYWNYFKDRVKALNEGTFGSMLPIFNTHLKWVFGATIASLASFEMIKNALLGILPQYPLISLSITCGMHWLLSLALPVVA